jgi:hypothetical protein
LDLQLLSELAFSIGHDEFYSGVISRFSLMVSIDRYAEKMIYSTHSLVLDLCDL